jgi:hypothetical protein
MCGDSVCKPAYRSLFRQPRTHSRSHRGFGVNDLGLVVRHQGKYEYSGRNHEPRLGWLKKLKILMKVESMESQVEGGLS